MFKRFADWLTDLLYKPGKKKWFIGPAVFLVFLSPVLLLASFSYITTYRDLTNFTLSRRQVIAYLAAATLKEKLDRLIDIGISLATRVRFRQLVGQGKWIEAVEILRTVPKDFSFIDRIFLTDPSGTLIADTPELPDVRGKNFASRDWYQGISNKWEPYVSEVYKRAAEPRLNVIAIAAPIKGENQKVIGILVLQVRLDTLFEWTKNVEVGPSGFVYFVDRRGHVAAHPGVPSQSEIVDYSSVPAVQKVLRGEKGVEIAFNPIENEERVAAYHPISGYGWGVIVQQPVSSAFVQRNDSLRRLLFVHGLIFLFASSLAYITLRTIAERKRVEGRLRLVVEAAPNAMIMVDREGKITLVNTQIEQLFGYQRDELLGQRIEILVPERFRSKHRDYRNSFFANPEARAMGAGRDLYGLRKDGSEVPIEIGLNPVTTPEGLSVLASIIDITERKKAEDVIIKLNEDLSRRTAELEATNKELEAFTYSVSHDLRAPLRSIDGFSQAVLEDYADKLDAQGKNHLERVRAASQYMAQLIDDMLNLSRVTRSEMRHETVHLSAMAREIGEALRKTQPEQQVEFISAENVTATGDERLLRVVMQNLLDNAWKYTGKHARARIEFGVKDEGGKPVFYVRDDGAGFDMAYADKLFGAFQRLHRRGEFPGTGIGLATVQRIIHRHGGRVWAEGEVEKGATFYFSL